MALDGTWKILVDSPMGKQEGSVTYTTDGNTLTGSIAAMGSTIKVENGTIDGDTFSHTMSMDSPMGKMEMKVSGKVSGDDITGEFKAMQFSIPFTGKRA